MRNVYDLAKLEIGTYEWAEGSNPRVDAYFDDVGFPSFHDDTAWCAAFVGAMLKRSGFPHTGKLTARSYIDWGKPVELKDAQPGDVVIFWRGSPDSWQGHVALFDRAANGMIYVLGGNQRDQVNISAYPASRLLSIRRMAPKRESRTLQGGATAGVGTAGTAVTDLIQQTQAELTGIMQYVPTLQWVFVGLTLFGIGYAIYARLDDRAKIKK
jgi:uncharacterized protein (TIGR02594 family)